MKFVCLGYIDESKFENLSATQQQKMMEDCFAYDDELRRGGHFAGGHALQSAKSTVTIRHNGIEVEATDGPFTETKEQIGGILLLEARDLNHAIQLMSKHPGCKVGPFEIRAADKMIENMVAERDAQFRASQS